MDAANNTRSLTGLDLRLLRTAHRLTVAAVAESAGWSRQRVTAIEATGHPTARAADRYLAAVMAAAGRGGR